MCHITDFVVSSHSISPSFPLWLVKFCSTVLCQERIVVNQQASSLSSQPQISFGASAVLLRFGAQFGAPCPSCSTVTHSILLWVPPHELPVDWSLCTSKPTAEVSQREHGISVLIAKYFNLTKNLEITPKYTTRSLYVFALL